MKCVHAMPFGAELRADGSVRFRLFAPAAKQVALVLDAARGSGARETLPMSPSRVVKALAKR